MAHDVPIGDGTPGAGRSANAVTQAHRLLWFGFVAAPLLAGLDKFFNLMTDWTQYLAPIFSRLFGGYDQEFMYVVGVIEVAAGIGAIVLPRIFGYVIAAWLLGIIINLLLTGVYYDIALRDFGLMLGALALARLSAAKLPRT